MSRQISVLGLVLLLACGQVRAAGIVIDSVLGERSRYVPGIESFSQDEAARHAAMLTLAAEGWDLASVNGWLHRRGEPAWSGGIEWAVAGVTRALSEHWGYPAPGGDIRSLQFHTDDTVSRPGHSVGEPSPFGVISGSYSTGHLQLGVKEWGTFSIDDQIEPVFPTYDMPNGENRYGDKYYSGFGDGTAELATLTQGRGDLTDGAIARHYGSPSWQRALCGLEEHPSDNPLRFWPIGGVEQCADTRG